MAIAPSKLGELIDEEWHSEPALLLRVRSYGLVREDASDGELRSTLQRAKDEDAALPEDEREFNSPNERVRVFLEPFLTNKGKAWAEPLKLLDLSD